MDIQTLSFAMAAFLLASFLKGLTGIGFSTLCLGFLALFIDIKVAIPLVFLPSLCSNLMVMADAGHFFESIKRFFILFLSGLPGLFLGIWFLDKSHSDIPKAVLGGIMLIYGIWGLKQGMLELSGKKEKQFMIPVGLVSGMVNGATGSQIMPIMPYLLSLDIDRNLFVQTINLSFTINTLIMMLCLGKLGLLTLPVAGISALGILPVAAGIYSGSWLRNKTSEFLYRKLVFSLLICLGLILALKPFGG